MNNFNELIDHGLDIARVATKYPFSMIAVPSFSALLPEKAGDKKC